jgi:putative redox protein
MKSKKIHFLNKDGLKLAGYIDSPEDDTPIAYAIFAHCFTCSKDLKAIANIDSSLAKNGIATLRFDFTGIGESEGNFPETNYSGYLDDVLSAAEFLSANFKPPKLIIGHSLGGCIAIESASKIPSIKAIAVIGTPSEPSSLSHKLKKTKERAESEETGETTIGGVKFRFKKQFFDDLENHKLEPYIRNLSKPLLILHSPIDTYTPIESGEEIFETAKHPKSFVSLDKIDHLMLNKQDAMYVGDTIALWARRYL